MFGKIDESIVVLEHLPHGAKKMVNPQRAYLELKDGVRWFYYCNHCKGWIEGHEIMHNVSEPFGGLCGRRGTEKICIRCGTREFSGMIS